MGGVVSDAWVCCIVKVVVVFSIVLKALENGLGKLVFLLTFDFSFF